MSKIRWNSQLYLRYERERTQPSIDLASRIDLDSPAAIIDLGCGPGNSTRGPRERWRQRFSTRTFLIRIAKPADSDAVSALLVASYSSLHREGKQFPAGHPCSRTGRLCHHRRVCFGSRTSSRHLAAPGCLGELRLADAFRPRDDVFFRR